MVSGFFFVCLILALIHGAFFFFWCFSSKCKPCSIMETLACFSSYCRFFWFSKRIPFRSTELTHPCVWCGIVYNFSVFLYWPWFLYKFYSNVICLLILSWRTLTILLVSARQTVFLSHSLFNKYSAPLWGPCLLTHIH